MLSAWLDGNTVIIEGTEPGVADVCIIDAQTNEPVIDGMYSLTPAVCITLPRRAGWYDIIIEYQSRRYYGDFYLIE